MKLEYFIMHAHDGAYLRFSRGVPGGGPPKGNYIFIESSVTPDGPWAPRGELPPVEVGYVAHTAAAATVCELIFGRHGSFIKGSKEDVEKLVLLVSFLRYVK